MENINKIIILTLSLLLLINMNLNAEKNDGIQQTIENFIIYMKNNKKEEIDNIITNNELKDKIHSLMNNYKIIDFNYFINSMSNINDLNLNEKKVVIRYNMKYE